MKIIQLGCLQPKYYEAGELGSPPILKAEQPTLDTHMHIVVSPSSTLLEAVSECKTLWHISAHDTAPSWIGYNAETIIIATVLNAEFGGNIEIKDIT